MYDSVTRYGQWCPAIITNLFVPISSAQTSQESILCPLFLQLLDLPDLALYNLSLSHQLNDKKDGSLCSAFSTHYVFQMCPPCSMPFNTFQD